MYRIKYRLIAIFTLFFCVATLSSPLLFAKTINIVIPRFYVPDPDLPTEYVFTGTILFEENWLKSTLGDNCLSKLRLEIKIGDATIGKGSIENTEKAEIVRWKFLIDLSQLDAGVVSAVREKKIKILLFYGSQIIWSQGGIGL